MHIFGFEIKTHPKNRTVQVAIIPDRQQRRRRLIDAIDRGGYQKLVVFSAGMGFLAGAYEIFASSLIMPMIKLVFYYPNKMPSSEETLLRCATLLGAMLGQVSFGFLADLYGRRKMYGIELLIMVIAIVGLTMSSSGAGGSMSIFGWLFSWRFIMGIGIGADYPLSATITAEFAPTRHRARMLATVFSMQPVGYALATLITLGITWGYRHEIPSDLETVECNDQCIQAADRSWRIIIGLGAVPAIIAMFFRRSIPESPLYTADVINQLEGAISDHRRHAPESYREVGMESLVPQSPTANPAPCIILLEGAPENEDDAEKLSHRWTTYWNSFHAHFIVNRFWISLLGVSLAWCLLDMSYYALGSSSSTVVTKIFNSLPLGSNIRCTSPNNCTILDPNAKDPYPQSLYTSLFANAWRSLVIVCAGSLMGGFINIMLIKSHSPRTIQTLGFLILIPLFLLAGLLLVFLQGSHVIIPTAIIYFAAQMVFQIGPNFTTFMLPAEIFPTRHRAFAHGIAAASGKLGASLFQIFFQFVRFDNGGKRYGSDSNGTKWLGYTVLCFMPIMLVGAAVTWVLVPETRVQETGRNRGLDELEREGGRLAWWPFGGKRA